MKDKNIDIIKNERNNLPISVIIPTMPKRDSFFHNYCLPSILSNKPKEIIINSNKGNAPKKRNYGFDVSTQPYIFFCDDDIILPKFLLSTMYEKLHDSPKNIGYVYCGYLGIVLTNDHPIGKNFNIKSIPFNADKLKKGNYISTMSLIKRENFPKFDESLERLQDWDLYLTMLNNNIIGQVIENMNFMAFYLDNGITGKNNNNFNSSTQKIKAKHGI